MDENEFVKMGMEVALRPVTGIAENALGLAGGDWLSETRIRNREKLKARTREKLKGINISQDSGPSPSVVIPLLTAAQDEGREELLGLWASLLAAVNDPARQSRYRRQFVDIVKKLEPADAILLRALGKTGAGVFRDSFAEYAQELGVSEDQLEVSMEALRVLGLLEANGLRQEIYGASSLARELCVTLGVDCAPIE